MQKSAPQPKAYSPKSEPPTSSTEQISKITRRKKNTYSPSNLYLKGKFYYFRVAIPKKFRVGVGQSEVRIGLQTPYIAEARRIATALRVRMDEILEENVSICADDLRKKLLIHFVKFLEQDGKVKITHEEIKKRLHNYLQNQLNADSKNINTRDNIQLGQDYISMGQYSDSCISILKNIVNNPELLAKTGYIGVVHLLKEGFFNPEEVTKDNVLEIINEFIKTQITCHSIISARCNGDYIKEKPLFDDSVKHNDQIQIGQSAEIVKIESKSLKYSELVDKYIKTKISDGAWKSHSLPDHQGRLNSFIEVMGDKEIDKISRDDMRKYRDILRKLPPNRVKSKLYKDKSIAQILKMKPKGVFSIKTVNIFVEAVSSLFEWAIREGIAGTNPAKSLSINDERQDVDLRDALTVDDLNILFSRPEFLKNKIKRPSFYWAPIIALYTGMRLEEICQLHCSDIYQADDIWVIDINTKKSENGLVEKKVKTKNAVRVIPIHSKLIELGLIEYRDKIIKKKHERLFPDLKLSANIQKYGRQVGKFFSNLIKKCDISGKKSFHSLRHTFSDYFKVKNLHSDVFVQVFGHENGKLATRQYGSKFSVEFCYHEVISKIEYNIW